MANTITLKGTFANKGDTVTSSYTDTPVTLMAVYVDEVLLGDLLSSEWKTKERMSGYELL